MDPLDGGVRSEVLLDRPDRCGAVIPVSIDHDHFGFGFDESA